MDLLDFFNHQDNKSQDFYINFINDSDFLNTRSENLDLVEKSITTAINTRLERAASHCQALNLLSHFSSQISKENLTKYFPHWIVKLTHILTNAASNSQELIAVCRATSAFLVSCKQVPELDKKVSIYSIKQIIGIIAGRYSQEKNVALLNLLTVLLYHYPESCARFQVSLSQVISSCIDDNKSHLVTSSAKCYSLLVRAIERLFVHSSKDNFVILPDNSTANCHVYHQINLCNNLHTIMDDLFQDLVTASSELPYEVEQIMNINILQLPKLSCHEILEYYTALENRFTNICTFLSTLLKIGGSRGKKFVLPNVILQIICRGLSVTPANLQKDNNRKDILLLVLPKLYSGLLNVLETLITSFQQELLPYAHTVQHLILQTLEWTQQFSCKSLKNIRILTYRALTVWLQQSRSLSGFQLVADEFLAHILKDLSPPNKNVLFLTAKMTEKSTKTNSKTNSKTEKLKEAKDLKDYSYNGDSNINNYMDSMLSLQVLSTVQSIFSNVNCCLKQSFYDKIRNTVVLLLYKQYVNKISISTSKANTDYRLQLLRTMRVLQTFGHTSTPSPTPYAIKIFGMAISQDNNPVIVEEASLGLAELRHIIHPTAPSLMPYEMPTSVSPRLQSDEIIKSSQLEQKLLNDECHTRQSTIQFKRPRLEEDKIQLKTSVSLTNSAESKNENTHIAKTRDDEMIMSFCDLPSSGELVND